MKTRMRGLALLCSVLLALLPFAQSQAVAGSSLNYNAVPLALTWPAFTAGTFSSAPFSIAGLNYFQIVAIPNGTVSACSVSVDGATAIAGSFSTGSIISAVTIGSCASPILYTTSSAVSPALQGRITVTVTGTGSVTLVVLGYHTSPSSGCPA